MRDRAKPNRHASLRGPGGRRVTIQPGGRSQDIAAEIAQKVMQMSPAEVEALITSRGLTHLTNPERIAAILGMTSDGASPEPKEDDIGGPQPSAPSPDTDAHHDDGQHLRPAGQRHSRR